MMSKFIGTSMLLFLSMTCVSQEMGYALFGTLTHPYKRPYAVLTLDSLDHAHTLQDLYARFPSSWIAQYLNVEIAVTSCGKAVRTNSEDEMLTPTQLTLLRSADTGCVIDVIVEYIPDNTLKHNPPRTFNFSLTPIPIREAKFPGGTQSMQAYLKTEIYETILEMADTPVAFVKATFNITEHGQIEDAEIQSSSGNAEIDQRILTALCNMPAWTPAQNRQGEPVLQGFEFTLGTDLLRCDYAYP